MLCAVCQDIFACGAPPTATVSPFGKYAEYISFTREHHKTLSSFLDSARRAECFICYHLLERACECYGFREPRFAKEDPAGEGFSIAALGATRSTSDAASQNAPALQLGVSIRTSAFEDERKTEVAISFEIWPSSQITTPEERKTDGGGQAVDVDEGTAHCKQSSKVQAQKWYRECSTSHHCGSSRDESFRPTRLVEVLGGSHDQRPEWRVVLTEETAKVFQHGYATLSHRWPPQGMVSLTQDTFLSFRSPQAEDGLPERWRQALEMARFLDIRYIWIDSLCIVQDSVEDWRKESLMMDKVYQNSIITCLLTTPPYDFLPMTNQPYATRFKRCFVPFNLTQWLKSIIRPSS